MAREKNRTIGDSLNDYTGNVVDFNVAISNVTEFASGIAKNPVSGTSIQRGAVLLGLGLITSGLKPHLKNAGLSDVTALAASAAIAFAVTHTPIIGPKLIKKQSLDKEANESRTKIENILETLDNPSHEKLRSNVKNIVEFIDDSKARNPRATALLKKMRFERLSNELQNDIDANEDITKLNDKYDKKGENSIREFLNKISQEKNKTRE